MDGFAVGLFTYITKDGQATITAHIPLNGKKITSGMRQPIPMHVGLARTIDWCCRGAPV